MKKQKATMNNSGLSGTNLNSNSSPRIQESGSSEQSNVNKFMNNIKSEIQVQKHIERSNRELHQKRVQNLRKELEYLKATEWKYQSVDPNWEQSHRN